MNVIILHLGIRLPFNEATASERVLKFNASSLLYVQQLLCDMNLLDRIVDAYDINLSRYA